MNYVQCDKCEAKFPSAIPDEMEKYQQGYGCSSIAFVGKDKYIIRGGFGSRLHDFETITFNIQDLKVQFEDERIVEGNLCDICIQELKNCYPNTIEEGW